MDKELIDLKVEKWLDIKLKGLEKSLIDRIDAKFKNLSWLVSIFVIVFTAFFGFLFYFVNDQYNDRFSKLEVASFESTKDTILDEIRGLKQEVRIIRENYNGQDMSYTKKRKKGNIVKRK